MQKTLLLFLVSFSITAQIKGVVKDSISGKPIPYVNIWVQNENIGTTSEENGEFTISSTDKNKNLIFSALGFEKKNHERIKIYFSKFETNALSVR
ncbi:carboxypeptidase-like regulatory domain-containing protein [Flavobacterium psychrophilum]|uniref:carboxypeptidase-like regulatory domain-containing protein n=1 Tax=Flavobacterium psychrophilum TaxID=96345 RepID=UPI00068DA36E|nr:carboxypeptidase-like regulatory domain-containing protein [Flavobacterium psychrophilum]